ncbi:MAG: hypothetical protein MK135_15635 [Polyangiaceae bacterium]|nr:hypothetical protein [Polyangiaceae bacterium]
MDSQAHFVQGAYRWSLALLFLGCSKTSPPSDFASVPQLGQVTNEQPFHSQRWERAEPDRVFVRRASLPPNRETLRKLTYSFLQSLEAQDLRIDEYLAPGALLLEGNRHESRALTYLNKQRRKEVYHQLRSKIISLQLIATGANTFTSTIKTLNSKQEQAKLTLYWSRHRNEMKIVHVRLD